MKKWIPKLMLLLALVFGLTACTGSKAFYKKGKKLEKAGLSTEAASFYIESLKRKRSNEDAIISLKKIGQQVLDDELAEFYKHYTAERYRDAVYKYIDAENFKSRVEGVGVQLDAPTYYRDYYEESRSIYIAELYDLANTYLEREDFSEAEVILTEIKTLDPSYKDVNQLSDFAFVEPKYRQALNHYDHERYRKAYLLFREINQRVGGYKESAAYAELALESAQFPIGILPIENKSGVKNLESGISASIIRDIKDLDDPFIRVVDRTKTDVLLEEQFYNMSGAIEQSSAIETGTLFGTKAILVGKIISATANDGKLVKRSQPGWLGKEVRYVDAQGVKRVKLVFDKVYYQEYEQEKTVTCTFQYQIISTETGEILLTDVLEINKRDRINYASFKGNTKYLYAGYWRNQYRRESTDKRYGSYSEKRKFDQLLRARKNIKSTEELRNDIFDDIGKSVAAKLNGFNPEV
jgi:tetratricopeptide (TPR) repeat protein